MVETLTKLVNEHWCCLRGSAQLILKRLRTVASRAQRDWNATVKMLSNIFIKLLLYA